MAADWFWTFRRSWRQNLFYEVLESSVWRHAHTVATLQRRNANGSLAASLSDWTAHTERNCVFVLVFCFGIGEPDLQTMTVFAWGFLFSVSSFFIVYFLVLRLDIYCPVMTCPGWSCHMNYSLARNVKDASASYVLECPRSDNLKRFLIRVKKHQHFSVDSLIITPFFKFTYFFKVLFSLCYFLIICSTTTTWRSLILTLKIIFQYFFYLYYLNLLLCIVQDWI